MLFVVYHEQLIVQQGCLNTRSAHHATGSQGQLLICFEVSTKRSCRSAAPFPFEPNMIPDYPFVSLGLCLISCVLCAEICTYAVPYCEISAKFSNSVRH